FLGRMSADKGAHRAIWVAKETGLPLKLAGKKQDLKEHRYFHELVEPHLGDEIEYLGEVTHGQKVELLQNARATLFPIEWEEPFGPERMIQDYLRVYEAAARTSASV